MRLYLIIAALPFLMGCDSLRRLTDGRELSTTHGSNSQGPLVLVVAGQSNAEAIPMGPDDVAHSTTGKVRIRFQGNEDNAPYDGSPTEAAPARIALTWIRLGDMLATNTGRDVEIVNVAIGGTTSDEWAGRYKSRLVDAVGRYKPAAVLWVQGESDSCRSIPSERSYTNYRAIVDAAGGVPFYMALDGYCQNDYGVYESGPVRAAQQRMIAEGHVRRGPDVDALRVPGETSPDFMHFTGNGYTSHAKAWLEVLR